MIISASFSKPTKDCLIKFNRSYQRIKIKLNTSSVLMPKAENNNNSYSVEFFTDKQAFHSKMTEKEVESFINENAGKTFKNCVYKTQTQEITILTNKKGKTTTLTKNLTQIQNITPQSTNKKNYILQEGSPIDFLVFLGIMTPEGKVISSKYDKFKQINRFLEFIDDIIPSIERLRLKQNKTTPLHILDFGCGKSYLTFAVYYYLCNIKKINAKITGLDLKEDVINYCNKIASSLNYTNLHFSTGNIADYKEENDIDIVITLHACDTATDYALSYAIKHNANAILSVPCCQHEINTQLNSTKNVPLEFKSILKYGILKERFSSIITDALRAEYLEQSGYNVQILEFIDMEHTPKNLLIRAVKKESNLIKENKEKDSLIKALNIKPTLKSLLELE